MPFCPPALLPSCPPSCPPPLTPSPAISSSPPPPRARLQTPKPQPHPQPQHRLEPSPSLASLSLSLSRLVPSSHILSSLPLPLHPPPARLPGPSPARGRTSRKRRPQHLLLLAASAAHAIPIALPAVSTRPPLPHVCPPPAPHRRQSRGPSADLVRRRLARPPPRRCQAQLSQDDEAPAHPALLGRLLRSVRKRPPCPASGKPFPRALC